MTSKIDSTLLNQIKAQVIEELKSDKQKQEQQQIIERENAIKSHQTYVAKMKQSKDPWVEIQGWAQTPEGVRVELDWNDAFADYLKQKGIPGADDQQIVQQWITLLLRDMADEIEEKNDANKSQFS